MQRSTTARLLAVADIVEANDGRWRQSSWAENLDSPANVNAQHTCGSYACIAGWGIALMPKRDDLEESRYISTQWREGGRKAFGLDFGLSAYLFEAHLGRFRYMSGTERAKRVAAALRYVASFPAHQRTYHLIDACEGIINRGVVLTS